MTFKNLKEVVMSKGRGTIRSIVWERPVETLAAFRGNIIMKRTSTTVRLGVDYNNISAVKKMRESGELPASDTGMRYGQWKYFPYFIESKGKLYLRCATFGKHPKTVYFLNGRKVEKSEILHMLPAKEKRSDNRVIFDLKCENIIAVR